MVLTAGSTGEAAIMVEVAHGLASLVCSIHPLAALHAGAWKRERETEVRSRTQQGGWDQWLGDHTCNSALLLGSLGPGGSLKPQDVGDIGITRPGRCC